MELIRSILKVRIIGSIVRRLHGPSLRCAVAVETTQLYIGWLRSGWRHGHPISKTPRHQVLCRARRPVLALCGERSRSGVPYGGGLFPFAAWAAFLPRNRSVTHACRLPHASRGPEGGRRGFPQ